MQMSMSMYMTIDEAIAHVKDLHAGQTDFGGVEYWKHCVATMNNLPLDATHEEKLIALFHDVIEDVTDGEEKLKRLGVPSSVIAAVALLSHNNPIYKGLTYHQYIMDIVAHGDRRLIRVKMAANARNNDPSRVGNYKTTADREYYTARYTIARDIMVSGLRRLDDEGIFTLDVVAVITMFLLALSLAVFVSPALGVRMGAAMFFLFGVFKVLQFVLRRMRI